MPGFSSLPKSSPRIGRPLGSLGGRSSRRRSKQRAAPNRSPGEKGENPPRLAPPRLQRTDAGGEWFRQPDRALDSVDFSSLPAALEPTTPRARPGGAAPAYLAGEPAHGRGQADREPLRLPFTRDLAAELARDRQARQQAAEAFGFWRPGDWRAAPLRPCHDDIVAYLGEMDRYRSLMSGQRAVFGRVGREFMHEKRNSGHGAAGDRRVDPQYDDVGLARLVERRNNGADQRVEGRRLRRRLAD